MILGLVFTLVVAALQEGSSAEPQAAMQQRAHDEYERHKQTAIRINELSERINSEADASSLISEIASLFAKELASGLGQRQYPSATCPR
jgi:hypothetical protein